MPERSIQNSIFWVEVEKIQPNPYQPRRVFDEAALLSLAESIRQYGVLQPLTVSRREIELPGEGIRTSYELIAGERRLRASKIAGLKEVPVVIRTVEDTDRMKLELAIIENLQREDLNAVDRAEAFRKLADEFHLKHGEIGARVGKSREYVSNTLRILLLPEEMREALRAGTISEGHTRPLLMLNDKPEEQTVLFRDIIVRRITVRDSEALARRVAIDKVRNKQLVAPDLMMLERQLSERLGTRVRIEKKDTGGKMTIDFFSPEDLSTLCLNLTANPETIAAVAGDMKKDAEQPVAAEDNAAAVLVAATAAASEVSALSNTQITTEPEPQPEKTPAESVDYEDPNLYSLDNFTI